MRAESSVDVSLVLQQFRKKKTVYDADVLKLVPFSYAYQKIHAM